jgi:hypothetical protein
VFVAFRLQASTFRPFLTRPKFEIGHVHAFSLYPSVPNTCGFGASFDDDRPPNGTNPLREFTVIGMKRALLVDTH